ncbi:DUF167 domain-containing protein, partial [bacterium]|nr:DUF167 domain-containing protein [bacterium]
SSGTMNVPGPAGMIKSRRRTSVWHERTCEGTVIRVKVMTNAGCNRTGPVRNDELIVRLTAKPEKGRANRALIDILSETAGIPSGSIEILRGETSRHKLVLLRGEPDLLRFT